MKKVLLLNPPYSRPIMRDTFHPTCKSALYLWHPLDLLIQSGYLTGFDVKMYDGVIDSRPSAFTAFLDSFRPDAVLSLVSYPTLESDMRWLESIKEKYGSAIFALGDITYGIKEAFLESYRFADGILADFVSKGFSQYLRGMDIKNAAWRSESGIMSEWTREPVDYDRPRHDLLDLSRYYLPYWKPPFGSVYTSHGCTAKCIFCVAPGWGPTRFRTHEAVLDELGYLYSRGVRKIFFRDGSFNQSPKYMMTLCEEMQRRFPGLRLTTWFKPKPLDEEMARAMKSAGFQYVHIGCETGSSRFLKTLGKDFTVEDIAPSVEILHKYGIKAVGHFMAGVPGETEDDVRLTSKYLKKTQLDIISFSVFEYSFGIKIKKEEGASSPNEDKRLKRQLLQLYMRFYLRPSRWRSAYFFENLPHLLQSIPRAIQYIADLRLYPRFKSLK